MRVPDTTLQHSAGGLGALSSAWARIYGGGHALWAARWHGTERMPLWIDCKQHALRLWRFGMLAEVRILACMSMDGSLRQDLM